MRLTLVLMLIAAVVGVAGHQSIQRSAAGPAVCTQSFALFGSLSGHWSGTWVNHTFASNGTLTVDAEIRDDCTAEATIDGIFNQPGPQTINATYRDDAGGTVVEVQDHPIFGDVTVTIAQNGTITLTGTDLHQDISSVSGTGTVLAGQITLDVTLEFGAGGSATETIELSQESTPTPTPTPTPAPTATPTEAPGQEVVWGNNNCSGDPLDQPDPVDSLLTLRHDAGLSTSTGDCPEMGQVVEVANASPHPWGDVDCSGEVNPVDSLKLLRFDAGLSVDQPVGCPEIGDEVLVAG
ncbi:MAG: hypothetical protein WD904_01335 [Dehalococcoidia bacterium]